MNKTLTTLALALVTTAATFAQVGIGTKTPHPSAHLELSSTTKGFLPPRLSTTQRNALSNPTPGLTIFNTTTGCLESWDNVSWVSLCDTLLPPTVTTGACAGEPVEFVHDGFVYKPVEYLGRCWLDRNLGATRLPTAVDDIAASGDVYQWGRATDGHEKISSLRWRDSYPTTPTQSGPWDGLFLAEPDAISGGIGDWIVPFPTVNTRWQGVNGVNNPCPAGYRVPVTAEFQALSTSFQPDARQAAFNSPLKMTDTYGVDIGGGLFYFTAFAQFWSSTANFRTFDTFPDGFEEGYIPETLQINGTTSNIAGFNPIQGCVVRCIKD